MGNMRKQTQFRAKFYACINFDRSKKYKVFCYNYSSKLLFCDKKHY